MKNGRTGTDDCHRAFDSNDFHLQPFTRFPSLLNLVWTCLPVKTHSPTRRSEQTSFAQQDLGDCLLDVGHQEQSSLPTFDLTNSWISSLRRSCLVDVEVSCSGFMKAGSMRFLGLLPMANSISCLPLRVTCVFLTLAALRINLAGVICFRVV